MWEAKAAEERACMCMEEGRKWWVQVDVQREVKSRGSRVEKAEMKARAVCSWGVDIVVVLRDARLLFVCLWWAIMAGVF